jgi:hypothetical protein
MYGWIRSCTFIFDIDYAAIGWNHTSKPKFRLSGNELYYEVPPSAGAGTVRFHLGTLTFIWMVWAEVWAIFDIVPAIR